MSTANPYATHWRQFSGETTEHQLTVLHDDGGLYRHLRMAKPGTRMWSWDIITWPGSLAIHGDIGSPGIFTRAIDMLQFFDTSGYGDYYGDGSPFINPHYWSEKLEAGRSSVQRYSPDVFLARVRDSCREADMYELETAEFIQSATQASESEHEAREWMQQERRLMGSDAFWEADLADWDHHFILACYAIVTTVKAWDAR